MRPPATAPVASYAPPGYGNARPPIASRESAPARATNDDELERAMQESLMLQLQQHAEPQPGDPLSKEDLLQGGFYFEHQIPGSDTCGLNALNNLCQRPLFKLTDLQKAEREHARAQDGGNFTQMSSTYAAPTGFFDVEALKLAARSVGLEIVDSEPVSDFRKSSCFAFASAANAAKDGGSWMLGYLVYDRRPGRPMHYYTMRRDERHKGSWVKLDSLMPADGDESRNRRMIDDALWAFYESNSRHFQAWLLRWYPVVYRAGAAKDTMLCLLNAGGCHITEEHAIRELERNGWLVSRVVQRLLHELPQKVVREVFVKSARPSESEMRKVLEEAGWDLVKAQPAVEKLVSNRMVMAQEVDANNGPRTALSLCDWDPIMAATLLALQLQTQAPVDALGELREALDTAGGDIDRAQAVLELLPTMGNMKEAAKLLEQTRIWSVATAKRIIEVRHRFPRVGTMVALEVLRRNDDDPHAACEMLAEYERRVQKLVLENAAGDLFQGEEIKIAAEALNSKDWDPAVAFVTAKDLAMAVQQTRQFIRRQHPTNHNFFPVDVVFPALTAADMKPQTAASILLGVPAAPKASAKPLPMGTGYVNAHVKDKGAPARAHANEEEDDMCVIA